MRELESDYAGFVLRGIAYLVDCAIAFVFFAATQLLILVPLREALGIGEEWFYSGFNTQAYMLLTISLPIWLYFIVSEHSSWQGTLGKRMLKLTVVRDSSVGRIGLMQSLLRTGVKLLPWEIAHLTNNFPQPLMYAPEPGFRFGFALVGVLMGGYMAFVLLSKRKQGPHDLVAKTLVIKKHQ